MLHQGLVYLEGQSVKIRINSNIYYSNKNKRKKNKHNFSSEEYDIISSFIFI